MGVNKTALVIGATGLVGKHLTNLLLEDPYFEKVKVFVRRSTDIKNPKLEEYITDFNDLRAIEKKIMGDVLFSTLGTTIKQAGSKDAQYLVDFSYQYEFAKMAFENGVTEYFLVSSSGANSKSRLFYTRMKGELEVAVSGLNFPHICIFRPSLLLGKSSEIRTGEIIGEKVFRIIKHLPLLKKYRAIKGEEVAKAMINVYKRDDKNNIEYFTLNEIFNEL